MAMSDRLLAAWYKGHPALVLLRPLEWLYRRVVTGKRERFLAGEGEIYQLTKNGVVDLKTDAIYYFDVDVFGGQGERCAQYLARAGYDVAITARILQEEGAIDGVVRRCLAVPGLAA